MMGGDNDRQRIEKWMTALAVAGMLAWFLWVIATHYYIRASSDPHNWIKYAHNFGSEVLQSRWPYGFPLFLRLLLPITGPYYIFLVNLPLLMLAFFLIGRLGSMPGGGRASAQGARFAGIAAVALALSADARELIHYVNPYRDPLSYVLLLTSAWLLVKALAARRHGFLFLAGVLLGLACSVREPSVLMLLPMLIYGMVEWYHAKGAIPLWKSTGLFAAGFVLALIPLAVQTYLATHQVLLPPQASMQGSVVPGAHFLWVVFRSVSQMAWTYYAKQQIWIPLLAGVGLLTAVWDRQRVMLFLVTPAAICYLVFYSFYWTFVSRYFYVSTLFLCLLAGYGAGGLLRMLNLALPASWNRQVAWIALGLLCVLSGRHLMRSQPPRLPLQVADARAFANHLAPLLPANAVVFAQRNLCELIQAVVLRDSYAWSPEPDIILRHVEDLQAAGRPVYTMKVPDPQYPYGDTIHLHRLYDLEPIEIVDPGRYHLSGFASQPFTLLKVLPPTRHLGSAEVSTLEWEAGSGWLALDPGYLATLDPSRTYVKISVNGTELADAITWEGAQFLEIRPDTAGTLPGRLMVEVSSDGPLPAEIRAAGGDLGTPIELDFDLHAVFDQRWRWQGGLVAPDLIFRKPRLQDDASIIIPVPAPRNGQVMMEWQLRSIAKITGGSERIFIFENETLLGTAALPRDHQIHEFIIDLPPNPDAEERTLRLVRENPQTDHPPELEIHRLLLHRPGARKTLDIRVGEAADAPYIQSGFYHRENPGTPQAFRWTDGKSELRLSIAPPDTAMMLRVHYSVEHIPTALRPVTMAVQWNGRKLPPATLHTDESGMEAIWTGHVPAEEVLPENRLILETPPWSPQDFGIPDTRRLGVSLRRIEWKPIE